MHCLQRQIIIIIILLFLFIFYSFVLNHISPLWQRYFFLSRVHKKVNCGAQIL